MSVLAGLDIASPPETSDDDPIPCSVCGSTETTEITHEDEHSEQSITICAECGDG